jgi:hypothetical protein
LDDPCLEEEKAMTKDERLREFMENGSLDPEAWYFPVDVSLSPFSYRLSIRHSPAQSRQRRSDQASS